jgi:hypothetical protein
VTGQRVEQIPVGGLLGEAGLKGSDEEDGLKDAVPLDSRPEELP